MNFKLFFVYLMTLVVYSANAQNAAYSGGKGDGFAASKLILRAVNSDLNSTTIHPTILFENGALKIENAQNIQAITLYNVLGNVIQEWRAITPNYNLELHVDRQIDREFILVTYISNGILVASKIFVE